MKSYRKIVGTSCLAVSGFVDAIRSHLPAEVATLRAALRPTAERMRLAARLILACVNAGPSDYVGGYMGRAFSPQASSSPLT